MNSKNYIKGRLGLQDFAGLLHDLKSPLMLIEANLDRLVKRWGVSDRDANLNSIRDLIKAAEYNTQSALLVSQITQGKYQPKIKNVNVNRYVTGITKSFRPLARKIGVTIDCKLDPELKVCQIDPFAIHRILTNLISNALKFAPSGSEITVGTMRKGHLFELTVADKGPGISPSQRSKLFKPWNYGKGAIGACGHGLGLYVVKSLALQLGGSVAVKSRPGHGAKFSVSMEGV